jgi:DNA-binding NarL/FixJ family response regulator
MSDTVDFSMMRTDNDGPVKRPIRVSLCVDHPLVADGLRAAFTDHEDIEVTGCDGRHPAGIKAGHGGEADVAVTEAVPAVLSRLRHVTSRDVGPRIVAIGDTRFAWGILAAVSSGVRGLVNQRSVARELPVAVRAAAGGRAFLSPDFTGELFDWLANRLPEDPTQFRRAADQLSCREQEVLKLLGNGFSNTEIAKKLVISDTTVRSHVYHILNKLDLPSRTQAALFGYRFQFTIESGHR